MSNNNQKTPKYDEVLPPSLRINNNSIIEEEIQKNALNG